MSILSFISSHPLTFIAAGMIVAGAILALRLLTGLGGEIEPERWSGQ